MLSPTDSTMPLTAHLEELRWRIVKMAIGITLAFAITYSFADPLLVFLTSPLIENLGEKVTLVGTGVTEAFFTKLKVALIASIFLSSPVIFYQGWAFIAPGLYDSEKNYARPFVFFATFFFLLGAAFCFYAVFPIAFAFFVGEFESIEVEPTLRISEYLAFSSRTLLAFGAIFEMPVLTYFLARIGVVDYKMMIGWFRYAIVAVFIIAAILTPPDAASQLLMAIPMVILYCISIGVAYLIRRPPPSDRQ